MSWIEIILIGAGLSLDVFAYALCRGAVVGEVDKKSLVILGGGFTLWNLISLTAGNSEELFYFAYAHSGATQ